jgi:hypothetical protein
MMKPNRRNAKEGPRIRAGSRDARKTAAVILEVLSGMVRPREGAAAIGVSVNRYYQVEKQALEALVKGCEPRPMGKRERKPEEREAELRERIRQLENEVARHQAVARAAQKALGILPARVDPKKRKPRRIPVRAAKMVRTLQKPAEAPAQA